MYRRHRNITKTIRITAALLGAALTCLLVAAGPAAAKPKKIGSFAPHLGRSIVSTEGDYMGSQLATWYGPGFWGNGTACGQTLRENTWGIAHRTLPCGTLVTLANKGRKVTVRVIDRGPYSGATVDLTARTKYYLRFTAGTIRMAKVDKFRVVPGSAVARS